MIFNLKINPFFVTGGPLDGNSTLKSVIEKLINDDFGSSLSPAVSKNKYEKFDLNPFPPLFSYQKDIVNQLNSHFNNKGKSTLVSLPTGGGKTRTAIWFFLKKFLENPSSSLIWIAPSQELIDQAVLTLKELWEPHKGLLSRLMVYHNDFGYLNSKDNKFAVFLTVQKAMRSEELNKIKRFNCNFFVFDEAHHAIAPRYQDTIKAAKSNNKTFIIGLSATPGRTNIEEKNDLLSLFDNHLITASELGKSPIEKLQNLGVLSHLKFNLIDNKLKNSKLPLNQLSLNPERFWKIVETIKKIYFSDNRKVLVFAESISYCYCLAGVLKENGILSRVLVNEINDTERENILNNFKSGNLKVIINISILKTGFDCPGITDIILAKPIKTAIQWEQILGRGLRGPKVGGEKSCNIWELDDHKMIHGSIMSYMRFKNKNEF